MAFLPSRMAAAILGLHPQTFRNYADQGKIPYYRNSAGQRLYDVDAFLGRASKPETVCYCRVSSAKQRGDLQRQCAQMRSLYPNAEIIRDIGGGLNWKRKGLLSILERIHRGDKLTLVVAHRDRLARFGFELIEWLVQQNGGQVLVLHQPDASPNPSLPKIYSPSSIRSAAGCTDSAATGQQSRRIQVYPNQVQKRGDSWLAGRQPLDL